MHVIYPKDTFENVNFTETDSRIQHTLLLLWAADAFLMAFFAPSMIFGTRTGSLQFVHVDYYGDGTWHHLYVVMCPPFHIHTNIPVIQCVMSVLFNVWFTPTFEHVFGAVWPIVCWCAVDPTKAKVSFVDIVLDKRFHFFKKTVEKCWNKGFVVLDPLYLSLLVQTIGYKWCLSVFICEYFSTWRLSFCHMWTWLV